MNHPTTAHSTPLDHIKVTNHASTMKSKSSTSSFSLKDQLRSLRQRSTPSPSTTHHVKLEGLKSDRQVREPPQNRPQQNRDVVYATAFGNVRSGWLQHPTSASFCDS